MKSIVVFNNKGGVGKTTLLCNIASYLAFKKKKKVLVVDADPQCNASIYLFPQDFINEFYSDSSIDSVNKIITPLRRGRGYILETDIPKHKSISFGVDVILGDTKLAVLEDFLSQDWQAGKVGDARGLQTTLVFIDLLNKLKKEYDYVFFDVGPSLGAINRIVLLACDYFIMPMSSDIFSLKAIDNISESLSDWKGSLDKGLEDYKRIENEDKYYIGEEEVVCNLRFLGYINQQYTAKKIDGNKRPVKAYDQIIRKMPNVISNKLSSFLKGLEMEDLKIGEIPTLHSLIPLSQSANKPIFALQGKDGVVGAHFKKVSEYECVIGDIVNRLENNMQKYDSMA